MLTAFQVCIRWPWMSPLRVECPAIRCDAMRCDSREPGAHPGRPRPRQGAGPGLCQNQCVTEWACLAPGDYVVAGAVSVLLLVRRARQILFVKRHAPSFPKKSIIVQPYDCRSQNPQGRLFTHLFLLPFSRSCLAHFAAALRPPRGTPSILPCAAPTSPCAPRSTSGLDQSSPWPSANPRVSHGT